MFFSTKDNLILVTNKNNKTYGNGITQKELTNIPYFYCDFNFQDLGRFIISLFPKNYSFSLTLDRIAILVPFILNGNGYACRADSM